MKIEIKSASGQGYKASILENGKRVEGIREALISIKPDRLPILLTDQVILDESGHPFADESGESVASRFVVYYPGEFSMEA